MSPDKKIPKVRLRTPKFKSEAEEAAWWDSHPEVVLKAFERVYGKSAVQRVLSGKPNRKRPPTQTVTIRLPVEDVERARRLAANQGLAYQTLVKSLLHEALNRVQRA